MTKQTIFTTQTFFINSNNTATKKIISATDQNNLSIIPNNPQVIIRNTNYKKTLRDYINANINSLAVTGVCIAVLSILIPLQKTFLSITGMTCIIICCVAVLLSLWKELPPKQNCETDLRVIKYLIPLTIITFWSYWQIMYRRPDIYFPIVNAAIVFLIGMSRWNIDSYINNLSRLKRGVAAIAITFSILTICFIVDLLFSYLSTYPQISAYLFGTYIIGAFIIIFYSFLNAIGLYK